MVCLVNAPFLDGGMSFVAYLEDEALEFAALDGSLDERSSLESMESALGLQEVRRIR